jgi:very-short-patch-repair endonuclease
MSLRSDGRGGVPGERIPSVITEQRVTRQKREAAREFRRGPTRAETILWQALRGGKLGGLHFRRQQVIDGYIVDFYCHAARLVVEVDGSVHEYQRGEDAEREQALEDAVFASCASRTTTYFTPFLRV